MKTEENSQLKYCRGYISSRAFAHNRVPQHIQNIIIRNTCSERGYNYLLSVTEYAIPACFMVLEELVYESRNLDGVALYSLFQLPTNIKHARTICENIINNNCQIVFCVEGLIINIKEDVDDVLIILRIHSTLTDCLNNIADY